MQKTIAELAKTLGKLEELNKKLHEATLKYTGTELKMELTLDEAYDYMREIGYAIKVIGNINVDDGVIEDKK